jgi:hypothetical protein
MDTGMYISLALLAVAGGIFLRGRAQDKRKAVALKAVFTSGTEFVGKDLEYIVSKAGQCAFYASMDHGRDVAQWRAGDVLVEA